MQRLTRKIRPVAFVGARVAARVPKISGEHDYDPYQGGTLL